MVVRLERLIRPGEEVLQLTYRLVSELMARGGYAAGEMKTVWK